MCQMDLAASLAALVNQPVAPGDAPDSVNVLQALLGKSKSGRVELVEQGNGLSLRQGRWKYFEPSNRPKMNLETNTELGNDAVPQLYDLGGDIGETRNLASQDPARVKAMAAKLEAIRRSKIP